MKLVLVESGGIRCLSESKKQDSWNHEGTLACGSRHALFLVQTDAMNKMIWSVGDNGESQLGRGIEFDSSVDAKPVLDLPTTSPSRVAAGSTHSIAVDSLGRVFSWVGSPTMRGRLGSASTPMRVVKGLDDSTIFISSVTCGSEHTVAIDRIGRVFVWGNAKDGRLGTTTSDEQIKRPTPIQLPGNALGLSAACGDRHTLILSNDLRVFATGASPATGLDVDSPRFVPVEKLCSIRERDPVTIIACGSNHSLAVTATRILTFGQGSCGKLGLGDEEDCWQPTVVDPANINFPICCVAGGNHVSLIIDADYKLWMFGLYHYLRHLLTDSERLAISCLKGPPTMALPKMFSKPALADAIKGKVYQAAAADEFCILAIESDAQVAEDGDQKSNHVEDLDSKSILVRKIDKSTLPPLPASLEKLPENELEVAILSHMLVKERRISKQLRDQVHQLQAKLDALPEKYRENPGEMANMLETLQCRLAQLEANDLNVL